MTDSLDQITKDILQCQHCELRMTATKPVPGIGQIGAKYFLIGEAPGKEEDEQGVPFVGAAGRRLDKLLALAKIDPNGCYLSNVCRCRPPKNRTPRKKEIAACVNFLWREIRLIKPEYLITLGATSLGLFTQSGGITQLHGTMMDIDLDEVMGQTTTALEKPLKQKKQKAKVVKVERDYASVLSELFSSSD